MFGKTNRISPPFYKTLSLTIPNNKKDALVNVKFDNLPVVKNQK